ncbi:MAG TPA: peroxiredoxin [Candidatus Eremiobacteraceae bacterium]
MEARDFSRRSADFTSAGAVIAGISTDSVASHQRFAEKFGLVTPLLADTDGAVCRLLGVPVGKSGSAARMTFVIGGDGVVRKTYEKVDILGHAERVLSEVKELGAATPPAGE